MTVNQRKVEAFSYYFDYKAFTRRTLLPLRFRVIYDKLFHGIFAGFSMHHFNQCLVSAAISNFDPGH